MGDIDKEFLKVSALFVGALVLIAFLGALVINWHLSYVCNNFEKQTGKSSNYVLFDTCYVKFNEEWMRYSEYESIRKDLYIKEK